jgi:type I restriction enzyme S subunit
VLAEILPNYLNLVLSSQIGRKVIEERARTTAGQFNVNLETLRSIPVPLVSTKEMKNLVSKVKECFALAESVASATNGTMRNIDAIEETVLAKAFRGELVPQDPNDEPASALLQRIKAQESPMKASERKKNARFGESTYREHNKPLTNITSILREMGEATVEQVYDASGRSMENFWDELAREVKAGTIQEIRKGQIIYLKVKN